MSATGALLRLHLKTQFAPAVLGRSALGGRASLRAWGTAVLLAVCSIPLLYTFSRFISILYTGLHAMGQESALVLLGVLLAQLLVLFLGLFHILSAFYFSSDLERLIPLPVRPSAVIFSRLAVVLLNELLYLLPLSLPVLLGFGILTRAPAGFWILLPAVFVLAPVIPLVLAALVGMLLMRVVNLSRRKDALIVIGSLLLIAFQIWIQMRPRSGGTDQTMVLRMLADPDGLVRLLGSRFPPAVWATRALTGGLTGDGLTNFLLLAASSAAAFGGLVLLAERLFYQGAIGLNEIAARRSRMSAAEMAKGVSSAEHPLRAIFRRELRLMNRTPTFLVNGMLGGVIGAVVLGVAAGGGRDTGISPVLLLASGAPISRILILAAIFVCCGCLGGTAASTISREGKQFWISKVIPVDWKDQITAKFLHVTFVTLVGMASAIVVSLVFFRVSADLLAPALLLALAGASFLNFAAISIDLLRPNLTWTNPQGAIKQNLNVLLALVLDAAFLSACGILARLLLRGNASPVALYLVLLGICGGAALAGWRGLLRLAERRYPEIEA